MFRLTGLINILTLALCVLVYRSYAQEEIPLGEVKLACDKYISAYSTPEEKEKWCKEFKKGIKAAVEDSRATGDSVDEQRVAKDSIFTWMADHKNISESKNEKDVLVACFYFCYFVENGLDFPRQVRNKLSPEESKKLIVWLNERVNERVNEKYKEKGKAENIKEKTAEITIKDSTSKAP